MFVSSKNQDWEEIPGFDPEHEQYVPLNLDKWLRDHGIEKEGERLGGKNQPAFEDDNLDACESQIVQWVNRRGRRCREDVSRHLSDLVRDLVHMETDAELDMLGQEVNERKRDAEDDIENALHAGRNRLTDKENDVREHDGEIERFRSRNQLKRPPDYSHRRTALRYISACLVVEAALNATLLMDVNPLGLLGSTIQMILIGAVNVMAAGGSMGALLRWRNHVSRPLKSVCGLGILLVLVFVVFFNLLVGHFRNSAQAALDDPAGNFLAVGNDALQRLLAAPFDLASFQTILLVLLGVLCFGIGAMKWYQRDDAYPGYGKKHRELQRVRDAYSEAFDKERDNLREEHKRHESRLADMRYQLTTKQSRWRELCHRGDHLVADYRTNLSQYQHDLNRLLDAYRTANRNARSAPPPPHFNRNVEVDEAILQVPEFQPPEETSIKAVADKVHDAIEHLQDAYRAARRKYPTLEELAQTEPGGAG